MRVRLWFYVALAVLGVAGFGAWFVIAGPESARELQRAFVRAHLIDPESAVFRGDQPSWRGTGDTWCGEVNARNRFGGMVGFTRYVAYVRSDPRYSAMDRVWFDAEPTFADANIVKHAEFLTEWQRYCEGRP